jgi:ribosome biogenesis GTPase A
LWFGDNPYYFLSRWRVTEISQIILVLLDSRCPTLHYPPSLSRYLADRKVILVLTKVDISGPARVESWTKYIQAQHPNVRIVQVESYTEKAFEEDHQGRAKFEPSIPHHFREKLVQVIKEVHAELLEPPENVKSNPKLLRKWVSPVKQEIDWKAVMDAKGDKVGHAVGGAAAPKPVEASDELPEGADNPSRQEPSYLTIGLIGQPNVGKSSLLNALFGASKVRASKTPGKTKHFQTLFWTPDVRLVDCPGLVMPNFVPMEMQVLCGTLPISRVSAVPACISYAANLLPLEEIYKLEHPAIKEAPVEVDLDGKRTWRANRKPKETKHEKAFVWTAMDILVAYADAKGWVTAQAGRQDVHRAGNAST